jgi:hypothetical protein
MGRTTNVARRRTVARERAQAARAAAAKRERRRRILVVGGSALGVLAVLVVIALVGAYTSRPKGDTTRVAALPDVVSEVTGVPASTLTAIGSGTVTKAPTAVHDADLTLGGKPEVLFIGAEFCPYCAAERWPLVQALSRFGAFSGLKTVHSASNDVFPDTSTFSFHGATYSSDVVAFVGHELETVSGASLDKASSAETSLWKKYTGQGSFPFLDIGGHYVVTTPSYDPGLLKGLTAAQIAAQLADPTSPVAKAVDGAANVITAAICTVTGGAPTAVCSAAGVVAAGKRLGG